MRDDDWPSVLHALAHLWHGLRLILHLLLNLLLGLLGEFGSVGVSRTTRGESDELLSLLLLVRVRGRVWNLESMY